MRPSFPVKQFRNFSFHRGPSKAPSFFFFFIFLDSSRDDDAPRQYGDVRDRTCPRFRSVEKCNDSALVNSVSRVNGITPHTRLTIDRLSK